MPNQLVAVNVEDERILRDLNPVTVRLNSGELIRDARALITSERFIVWVNENKGTDWREAFRMDVTGELPTSGPSRLLGARETIEVYGLTQNAIITVGYGCGCRGAAFAPIPEMRGH